MNWPSNQACRLPSNLAPSLFTREAQLGRLPVSDSMQTAEVTSQAAGAVSPTPAVSIVLVSFNSRKDLEPCIDSIFSAGINAPFEVIIVDNGSQDGTPELVRRRYPLARLIESKTNTGFAGGTNR